MAEKKAKTPKISTAQKKNLLKKIFDWICLAIFVLLIIALTILHAPWTVITVLIAILLANTIVPKPIRKWIWLTVVTIVVGLIIWVFLPDDNEGWRPYTFDKELTAIEAKRSISAEENAALIYNELLDNYDPNSFGKDFLYSEIKDLILSGFWVSKDYPEVASWLETQQNIINQLILACEKDKCRFSIAGDLNVPELKPPRNFKEVTDFWWSEGKRLNPMRHWSELLIFSANNDVAEGRVDEGLEKYIAVLQMAKHLYQQPTPLDLLVGIAINLHGLDQINKYVVTGDATDEQLQLLDNILQSIEHDWRSDLRQILDREKLMFKSFVCAMFYQTNSEGRVRLNRDPRSTLGAQFGYTLVSGKSRWKPMNPDSYWQIKFTKAMSVLCWFFVPFTPQKTAAIIDDIHQQYYSMADPDYDWQERWGKFSLKPVRLNFRYLLEMLSRILESNWPGIHDRYIQAATKQKGSRLLITLRRYKNTNGRWPESLDDIKSLAPAEIFVDPFNNGSFVYKLTDDSFILYSRGKNNIDEKGWYKDGADDWPIWPHKSRKTKEKKADAEQQ